MDFQGELDPFCLEDIQDGEPAGGEVPVAGVNVGLAGRWEEIELAPHAGAGEAVDDLDAEEPGGARCVLHLLGAALPHPLGVAVAPQARGQDALMALINRVIGHTLAYQVAADGKTLQVVLLQQRPLLPDVLVVLQRLIYLEVVSPAGELQAVKTPRAGLLRQLLQRQIGPLAGEESNGSGHSAPLCGMGWAKDE